MQRTGRRSIAGDSLSRGICKSTVWRHRASCPAGWRALNGAVWSARGRLPVSSADARPICGLVCLCVDAAFINGLKSSFGVLATEYEAWHCWSGGRRGTGTVGLLIQTATFDVSLYCMLISCFVCMLLLMMIMGTSFHAAFTVSGVSRLADCMVVSFA